ncbi:MAG: hypothetical protein ABJB47_15580 [Actinomycetota bacterium]
MASAAGSIDVSFSLIARGDVQGIPLAQLDQLRMTRHSSRLADVARVASSWPLIRPPA